jgi:hypothetical protein
MAFKISSALEGSYKWPVKVAIPIDGGKWHTQTFTGSFRRLPRAESKELVSLMGEMQRALDNGQSIEDVPDGSDVVRRVLTGWADIKDDDGEDLPFNGTNLERLLEVGPFVNGVMKAYFESLDPAKEKN